jgi:hypothetical protein
MRTTSPTIERVPLDTSSSAVADALGSILTGTFPSLAVGQTAYVERVTCMTTGTSSPSYLFLSLWRPALSGGTFVKVGPMDDGFNSDDVDPPLIVPQQAPLYWSLESPQPLVPVTVRLQGYVLAWS